MASNKSISAKLNEVRKYLKMMDSQETSFHQNRRIVLEIAHDVFMMDPSHAKQILLDETVWNACFYSRFGSLKNERLFEADLEMAASFYQNLILCIQCEYKVDLRSLGVDLLQHKLVPNLLDKSKDLQIDVLSIIYKSLIFLGDIERYKAQLSISPDNFKVSKSWYSKAFKVYPASGKSHSQIALLAAKELNNIDSIYFNSLRLIFFLTLVSEMYKVTSPFVPILYMLHLNTLTNLKMSLLLWDLQNLCSISFFSFSHQKIRRSVLR